MKWLFILFAVWLMPQIAQAQTIRWRDAEGTPHHVALDDDFAYDLYDASAAWGASHREGDTFAAALVEAVDQMRLMHLNEPLLELAHGSRARYAAEAISFARTSIRTVTAGETYYYGSSPIPTVMAGHLRLPGETLYDSRGCVGDMVLVAAALLTLQRIPWAAVRLHPPADQEVSTHLALLVPDIDSELVEVTSMGITDSLFRETYYFVEMTTPQGIGYVPRRYRTFTYNVIAYGSDL
jgi:hypothetical protein